MRRRRVAERIEVGLEVADRTVAVDEIMDVRLLEAVDDGSPLRVIAACHGLAGVTECEALEKGSPSRVDRIGVFEPGLIRGFNGCGIGPGWEGE